MKFKLILLFLGVSFFIACDKEDENMEPPVSSDALEWQTGKNEYNMEIEGDTRNFLIHVPEGYTGDVAVPMVFMLHGSGGDGQKFYNISRWVEKSETESFIAVFPTAQKYELLDGGRLTKWSSTGLESEVVAGVEIKDDILFIEELVRLCKETFNVDASRLYISGFSNGGGFVKSQVVVRLGHLFAATNSTGGVGIPIIIPIEGDRRVPHFNMSGSLDDRIFENIGSNEELPLSAAQIEHHEDLWLWLSNMCATLGVDTIYTEESHAPQYNLMIFDQSVDTQDTEYVFMMVKELEHRYPNGNNNPRGVVAVDVLWPWFMQHQL
jgi:polyhydroxybutyrate depolymerase